MQARLQNFAFGVACSAVMYAVTFKDMAASYQDVANRVSRLHYDIQPNLRAQSSIKATRPNWITGEAEPVETSGRTLKQGWNHNIRNLFAKAADRVL